MRLKEPGEDAKGRTDKRGEEEDSEREREGSWARSGAFEPVGSSLFVSCSQATSPDCECLQKGFDERRAARSMRGKQQTG